MAYQVHYAKQPGAAAKPHEGPTLCAWEPSTVSSDWALVTCDNCRRFFARQQENDAALARLERLADEFEKGAR